MPADAGKKNDVATPRTTCNAIRCQSCARSSSSRQAITLCAAPLTTLAATMTRLRGRRSAQTPPTRMKTICGAQPAASTKPRSEAEPRSSTAKARAMGAMAVPASEMSCPAKRNRNCRSPSGLRLLLRSITRMNLSPAARLCCAAHYAPGEAPNLSTTQLGTRAKRACPVSPRKVRSTLRVTAYGQCAEPSQPYQPSGSISALILARRRL